MSDARTNAGTLLYICTTPTVGPLDQTAFEALTWVRIKNVGTCGEFGTDETISSYPLEDGGTLKGKGMLNLKDVEFEYADDYDDAGQLAVIAAGDTAFSYPFKREKADKPTSGGTNTIWYTVGKVKKVMPVDGSGDDFQRSMSMIAQEQVPVKVAATTGA